MSAQLPSSWVKVTDGSSNPAAASPARYSDRDSAGIFSRDKRGVWAWYALRPVALQSLAAILGGTAPPDVPGR